MLPFSPLPELVTPQNVTEAPCRPLQRPVEPPTPRVVTHNRYSLPTIPDELPAGPRRLLELLQRLAADDIKLKGYAAVPNQHVFMPPQELLALVLDVARKTVCRWLRVLKQWGLVAARAHVTTTTHRGEQVNCSFPINMTLPELLAFDSPK